VQAIEVVADRTRMDFQEIANARWQHGGCRG
jgi:hypothetical protein